jgi:hypothetical protein
MVLSTLLIFKSGSIHASESVGHSRRIQNTSRTGDSYQYSGNGNFESNPPSTTNEVPDT